MRKVELLMGAVLGLVQGALLLFGIVGLEGQAEDYAGGEEDTFIEGVPTPTATPTPVALPTRVELQATPTPTTVPLQPASPRETDAGDVLLLYNSKARTNFDDHFCRTAEYYGLVCAELAWDQRALTDELLRDELGQHYELIGVSARTLLWNPWSVMNRGVERLQGAVQEGGSTLFIYGVDDRIAYDSLAPWTGGAVTGTGVRRPQDSRRDWSVSAARPEVTREFSGQVISSTSMAEQGDFAIVLGDEERATVLMSSADDEGEAYPIFVEIEVGAGTVFVAGGRKGESPEAGELLEMYYDPDRFPQLFPLMAVVRSTLGDEAWHRDRDYASLILGDPTSEAPWGDGGYAALFEVGPEGDFQPRFIFDLFIDKPVLLIAPPEGGNGGGVRFGEVADLMNELEGDLEWLNAEEIARRLYLQKTNDDGSVDLRMYADRLLVDNEQGRGAIYHITKSETLDVPIAGVTVNGYDFPYRVEDDVLKLDAYLPAKATMEVHIHYDR